MYMYIYRYRYRFVFTQLNVMLCACPNRIVHMRRKQTYINVLGLITSTLSKLLE